MVMSRAINFSKVEGGQPQGNQQYDDFNSCQDNSVEDVQLSEP